MDNPPELFVDGLGELSFKHGMIRIELVSLSGSEPRVVQRLITSLQSFQQMLQSQNGMQARLETAGVVRPGAPAAEHKQGATVARLTPAPRPEAAEATPSEPRPQQAGPPHSPNFNDD